MTTNPWTFQSLEDFHFYCCPECDERTKESQDLMNHALQMHTKSIPLPIQEDFISNLKLKENDSLYVIPSIVKKASPSTQTSDNKQSKKRKAVVEVPKLTDSKILYHISPKKLKKEEHFDEPIKDETLEEINDENTDYDYFDEELNHDDLVEKVIDEKLEVEMKEEIPDEEAIKKKKS